MKISLPIKSTLVLNGQQPRLGAFTTSSIFPFDMENDDTMEDYCAFCYAAPAKLLTCGKCKKRQFCSRECQKEDWKKGHKVYCGKSGEIGFDYTIRDCQWGKGVFALRNFEKNEKIMVERPVLRFASNIFCYPKSISEVPPAARDAVKALVGNSFKEIINRNGMSCTAPGEEGETGLFVTMSRVNHDCMGNADHNYLEKQDVKILVASRSIQEGEEITISYVCGEGTDERKWRLQTNYNFTCSCTVCQNPDLEAKLTRAAELDNSIMELASNGRIDQAMRKGKALLSLRDELDMSTWLYYRTYYDLFQVCITKKKYVREGRSYIRKAYEAVLAYYGDEDQPEVLRMKAFLQDPSSHRNYLILNM